MQYMVVTLSSLHLLRSVQQEFSILNSSDLCLAEVINSEPRVHQLIPWCIWHPASGCPRIPVNARTVPLSSSAPKFWECGAALCSIKKLPHGDGRSEQGMHTLLTKTSSAPQFLNQVNACPACITQLLRKRTILLCTQNTSCSHHCRRGAREVTHFHIRRNIDYSRLLAKPRCFFVCMYSEEW